MKKEYFEITLPYDDYTSLKTALTVIGRTNDRYITLMVNLIGQTTLIGTSEDAYIVRYTMPQLKTLIEAFGVIFSMPKVNRAYTRQMVDKFVSGAFHEKSEQ